MPKITIAPHPTHDIRCKDCKFWHPAYAEEVAVPPGASPIPLKLMRESARRDGVVGVEKQIEQLPTMLHSLCFYNPQWVSRGEDHYCAHWEAGKTQ